MLFEEIPAFNEQGNLPAGIYHVSWEAVCTRFGRNTHRQKLLGGLKEVLLQLKVAGCQMVYLDGSFVTRKHTPQDFDLCWDEKGVRAEALDPVFFDFSQRRRAQRKRFGGEIFPANTPGGLDGRAYLDFFQLCKRTKLPKGIVALELSQLELSQTAAVELETAPSEEIA